MTKVLILILTITNLGLTSAQDKNYSPVPKKENSLHKAVKTAINGMSKMMGFGEIESCPVPDFLKPERRPQPPEK